MEYKTVIILLLCGLSCSQRNLSPFGTATQSSTYKQYVASLAVQGSPTNDFSSGSCSSTAPWVNVAWWMLTFTNQHMFIEEVTIYFRSDDNIASSGIPSQYPKETDFSAELAIDGIRTGHLCAKTNGSVAWWLIDLQKQSVFETIYLSFQNKEAVKQFATNHSLFISNSSVKWNDGLVLQMTSNFTNSFPYITYSIYPAAVGRYIIYKPNAINGIAHVDICEVEIVGCPLGFYGEHCNKTCPVNCYSPCNLTTGVCMLGCKDGWINSHCNTSCDVSKFGHDCKYRCHCYNKTKTCDHVTGTCPEGGCFKGWKGNSCNSECQVGEYGYNCNETCDGCVGEKCNTTSGECDNKNECSPGWMEKPPFCKTTCPYGTFGRNCSHHCHCIHSKYCNRIDGLCPKGGCDRGWKGINCSIECTGGTYGFSCDKTCHNCLNHTCNRFNGSCTFGCAERYTNDICEMIDQGQQNGIFVSTAGIVLTVVIIIATMIIVFFLGRTSNANLDVCRVGNKNWFKKKCHDTIYENDVDNTYEMNVKADNEGYSTLSETLNNVKISAFTKKTTKANFGQEHVYELPEQASGKLWSH